MPERDEAALADRRDLNRNMRSGFILVAVLVLGLGGWAVSAELAGAVIAAGTLVVKSEPKSVQHPDGGIVSAIYVHDDDKVRAGAPLVRLNDTALKASLGVIEAQLDAARAVEARLTAEIAGDDDLTVPPELAERMDDPKVAALVRAQRKLMAARRTVRENNAAQLTEQVSQLQSRIEGYRSRRGATEAQLTVAQTEHDNLAKLLADKLVAASSVNAVERQIAQMRGEIAGYASQIAETKASVAERKVMIGQVDANFLNQALSDLQDQREKIAQLMQKSIATRDKLSRLVIVAPQTGVVHESVVHTVGGVIGAGETLMRIVPTGDELVVKAQVNPRDIDKVRPGQSAIIRIVGFNPRTTPDLKAEITRIAPDLTTDAKTGASYYVVRARIDPETRAQLPANEQLVPGMPTEVFIQSGRRTVMTYLMEPLLEQFRRAMRES